MLNRQGGKEGGGKGGTSEREGGTGVGESSELEL